MRWKWIVAIGAFLVVTLIAGIYVILKSYDYNKLKPRIARMVERATGRELNLSGDVNLDFGFSPALVVTDVTFANAPWGSQPQMIKIGKLKAQAQLLPLLFGDVELKQITLSGVDVLIETDRTGRGNWHFPAADSSAKKAGSFKVLKIELDQLRIENLHLAYRNGETESTTRFTLASLDVIKQAQLDALTLNLRGAFNDQPVALSGKIGLINRIISRKRFPLELSGQFSKATVKIKGAIDDVLSLHGLDLEVRASGTDLSGLDMGLGIRLPKTDAFEAAGQLKGSKLALALGDVSGKLSGSGVDVAISGMVGDLIALNGIDLQLKGSGKDLAELGSIIGEKLPATDDFKVQGRLTGSAKVLSLAEAQGSAHKGNLSLGLDGGIKDLLNFSGIDLLVKGSGKDLSEVGAIIDEKLPATDEFAVEGRIMGSPKALSLKEAQGSARRGNLKLSLQGGIKDLTGISGMDLKLIGSGKDLAKVGPIIGEKLPRTDAFTFEGRLTGSTTALSLQAVQGNASRDSLKLSLQGGIKDLLALSGMDLKLIGSGKDLAEVGPIIEKKLPATGEFTFQGRLTGSSKDLALQNAQARVGRGGMSLSLDGGIKNLIALTEIDIRFKGSGMDLAEMGPIIEKKLPTTDHFAVQGRLMGSTKVLSLRDAMGGASRDGMSVAFDGGITDVLALRGINFRLKASGKELAAIGPLVGSNLPNIGPFDVSGHLSGSAELLLLNEFSAIVDRSDFNGLAKIEFRKRPKITVRLESSVIDFTPFMRMAQKDKQELGEEEARKRRLFPKDPLPFDALNRVDADIVVKARNIHARDAQLEFGHLTLMLEDSNLSIDRLEATYKQTKISGNLHLDSGSPPQVATNFLVQNFDLGNLLKESGVSDQVRAVVDIAAHGKSSGDSIQSLMANLDGSIGAVMGKGFLTKYLDLLSMNLSQMVIPFWGSHKKAGHIKCAVLQFDIKRGVATSRAFVFDTHVGILTGEGDINLGTEQVNFLLDPKPKKFSLVSFSTKLRVTGTLLQPKVSPDALSLAAKGVKFLGHLALGPYGLLAPFVHLGAHQKHPCDIPSIGQQDKISSSSN